MARAKIASKDVLRDTNGQPTGVEITFTHGPKVRVNLTDLTPEMVMEAACHGLSQKLGDSYSGESDPKVAHGLAAAVADTVTGGEWNRKGQGDGGDFVAALANLTGQDAEAVRQMLATKDDDERKVIKSDKRVKAEMARIKAERLAKGIDSDATDLTSLF